MKFNIPEVKVVYKTCWNDKTVYVRFKNITARGNRIVPSFSVYADEDCRKFLFDTVAYKGNVFKWLEQDYEPVKTIKFIKSRTFPTDLNEVLKSFTYKSNQKPYNLVIHFAEHVEKLSSYRSTSYVKFNDDGTFSLWNRHYSRYFNDELIVASFTVADIERCAGTLRGINFTYDKNTGLRTTNL